MDNITDKPRSHIYIAGSEEYAHFFKRTNNYTYKIGRAHNLIDRFITAPDSYHSKNPQARMFPIAAWLWVEDASKVENNLKALLTRENVISVDNLKSEFPSGYTELICSKKKISNNIKIISSIIKSKPYFRLNQNDATL